MTSQSWSRVECLWPTNTIIVLDVTLTNVDDCYYDFFDNVVVVAYFSGTLYV